VIELVDVVEVVVGRDDHRHAAQQRRGSPASKSATASPDGVRSSRCARLIGIGLREARQ
jgi:hypothetical protein